MSKVYCSFLADGRNFSGHYRLEDIIFMNKLENYSSIYLECPKDAGQVWAQIKITEPNLDEEDIKNSFNRVLESTIDFYTNGPEKQDLQEIRERVYEKARMSLSSGTANEIADEVIKVDL